MAEATGNKRIAKNTMFLYMRMLLVMFVTFFTSRVVLEALGVDGYGVYTLIGGLAFSFGFFSSSLSNATQRYLSFAHGKGNPDEVKTIFNATALIYLMMGGIILGIGCVAGPILIHNVKIPPNMVGPAYWVFYCTIISLTITLTATMFDSVLIARENMKVYAYISIFEVLGKLGIAYLIFLTPNSKLVLYAIALTILTIIVKGIMIFFCIRHYQECRIRLHWDGKSIKELAGFIGWNGFGTLVFAVNEQGINLILNGFFGPVVNAARGVASQVNSAILHFSQNFTLAISPQMMKSYAGGDMKKFWVLFNYSGKYSFALLWLLFLPIILRREYILHLWLKNVPEFTSPFLLWIIIFSLINAYNTPQWFAIQAVGKLKKYVWSTNVVYLLTLPAAWLMLKSTDIPTTVFQVMTIDRIVYIGVAMWIVKSYIDFGVWKYIYKSVLPAIGVVAVTLPIGLLINHFIPEHFMGFVVNSVIVMFCSIVAIWFIILHGDEREKIKNLLISKFRH